MSDAPVEIGVIGAGSMGSLHARVVANHPLTRLAWVVDPDERQGRAVSERFGASWRPEVDDLAGVDAVVVAAPTEHHRSIATPIIDAGTPLLLEKPLADSVEHVRELVDLARTRGSVLMCGLLERFNPAVRTAQEIARRPIHVRGVRHSAYAERIRTGVAGDLLIHDLDMMIRLFGEMPESVSGHFGYFEPRSLETSEDIAEATLRFQDGSIATLSASRLSQRKVRELVITELDRLIEVDLLRQSITVYRNVSTGAFDDQAGYTQQTIIDIPVIRHLGEPLQLQLEHFLGLMNGTHDQQAELSGIEAPHQVLHRLTADAREAR